MPADPAATADTAEEPSLYEKKSPARRQFGHRKDQPRLSADQAARQGRVVSAALRSLPAGAAMTFLNTDQAGLGRPLDRAIESIEGLAAVEAALAQQAINRS
ncbi:hypothetical protein [Sphingomonas immobilis]|uniref:Antitoxin Xre/MbcA/ParS-like toxin-binding domain-containing protein n=1 Tax=Sphingomonas immobilis TaxID=3063997 RepID=A0ABT9A6Z7_9SPHN|nr:hypothetical protein [Sphingomonas sp. CA1-15]MDO7844537.1 hypothetical protein [Sphingomonas sp. CA1-15]